jgi:hypothetical protein
MRGSIGSKFRWRRTAFVLSAAAASMPTMASALATTFNWIGGTSDWNTPGNWNPSGPPTDGNYVNIFNGDTTNRTITYDYNGTPATFLQLLLFNTGGGTSTLVMSNIRETLSVNDEYIGGYFAEGPSVGAINQSNSTNSTGTLDMGFLASDNGSYTLSGSGILEANSYENVGRGGTGTFTQSGGANDFGAESSSLNVGDLANSLGTYTQSGGTLAFSGSFSNEYVGLSGNGTFNQSGGANTLSDSDLYVGYNAGSTGTYVLSGSGSISIQGYNDPPVFYGGLYVGYDGVGSFNQSSGTVTLTQAGLYLGCNTSTGNYTLSGTATLAVSQSTEYVGYASPGNFNQAGGANNLTQSALIVGAGGTGTYLLSNSAALSVGGDLTVGEAVSGTFNQSGSSNCNVTGSIYLGADSSATGSYILSNNAILAVGVNLYVGEYGSGSFTQSGGGINKLSQTANLYVGYGEGSTGTYTLQSGAGDLSLGPNQMMTSGNEYIGYGNPNTASFGANGTFNQSGASNLIGDGNLYLGFNAGATGTYTLSSGFLVVTNGGGYVGFSGTGIFNQTGGTCTLGFLDVGTTLGATGSCSLSGASLLSCPNGEVIGDRGSATFIQSGGTNNCKALAIANISGSTGTYVLSAGALTISSGFSESIGYNGVGLFNQTGGTNTCGGLLVGDAFVSDVGTGTYMLSGTGSLICTDSMQIAYDGVGNFIQTGGSDAIDFPTPLSSSGLQIADIPGAMGTYTLIAGALSSNNSEDIGDEGTGVFNQSGGTNLISAGELDIASFNGSVGTYTLSGGTLTVDGNAYVGGSSTGAAGSGTLTVSNTGQMTVTGILKVFGKGSVSISGTVGTVGSLSINTGGLLNVNSALLITSDGGNAQSAETFIQQDVQGGAIISGVVEGDSQFGVAYADGSDAGLEDSNLKSGQVVIEPDYNGDADLSGTVAFHDLQILLGNFGQPGFWDDGNFNNHTTVDFNDLQLLLGNFNDSTTLSYSELEGIENLVGQFGDTAIPNSDGTGFAIVAIPEPSSAILMAAGIGLLARRRANKAVAQITSKI